MYTVILKKDGFYSKEWVYDEEKAEGEYVVTQIPTDIDLLKYWNSSIKIEGQVLFADLINIIKNGKPGIVTFLELLTNSNIEPYLSEIDKERDQEDIDETPQLDHLCVQKHYSTENLGAYGGNFEIQDNVYTGGVVLDEEINYSLLFTKWNNLAHLPIKIEEKASLYLDFKKKDPHPSIAPKVRYYHTDITVGEFLTSLFDEVCFFGGPERRDEKGNDLQKSVEDIKDGTAELIPYEDIKDELEKKINK